MNNQKTVNVRLSQDGKFLIVTLNGETGFVSANLVRFQLGVPYTKKNGTHVTSEEIADLKRKSQEAYVRKITQTKERDQILYDGGPVDAKTKFVDKEGIHEVPSQLGAFVVIEASSHQEAAEIFLDHPHFAFFPGDGVEVIERRSRHEQS